MYINNYIATFFSWDHLMGGDQQFFYCFERERETSICCPTYWCIHWLILVRALTGTEHTTLAYRDNGLTKRTTRPVLCSHFQISILPHCPWSTLELGLGICIILKAIKRNTSIWFLTQEPKTKNKNAHTFLQECDFRSRTLHAPYSPVKRLFICFSCFSFSFPPESLSPQR